VNSFYSNFILTLSILVIFPIGAEEKKGVPVSELQRRILRMEQRALDLSQRLSDLSGTEPIELIDRNHSLDLVLLQTEAQLSYDQLPGPLVEPLPIPQGNTSEEKNSTVYQSEVNRVVATTQQRKGDYYLMPFVGLAFTSTTNYSFKTSTNNFEDELSGELGNSIGISAGRRWDNWLIYSRLAYQYMDFKSPNFANDAGLLVTANGIEESYSFTLGGGYTVPISHKLSTFGTIGIGFALRKNTFDSEFISTLGSDYLHSTNETSLVFTYDFSMGLEYMFSRNYSALLGYRLLGLTSNESFDSSFQHLIELGIGANF
jgi:opacity protein-like surface antigen